MAEVNCRNTRPGDCPDEAVALGKAVAAWALAWQKWWVKAETELGHCPGVKITPANINYSVCRAIRLIHTDWCTWAEVLRKTEQACCPGPTGHIPPPPPPPF